MVVATEQGSAWARVHALDHGEMPKRQSSITYQLAMVGVGTLSIMADDGKWTVIGEVRNIKIGPHRVGINNADWNYTYNTSPMLREAGIDMHDWEGKLAGEVVPSLLAGIANLQADPHRFEAMNPENGWGSYEGVLAVMREMLRAFQDNPKAYIRTCF